MGRKKKIVGVRVSKVELESTKNQVCNELPIPVKSIVTCLDNIQWGPTFARMKYVTQIRNNVVKEYTKSFVPVQSSDRSTYLHTFSRRITSLAWHKNRPFLLAAASKFGDMIIANKAINDDFTSNFEKILEVDGEGAGCAIFAMKFHDQEPSTIFRASLDGTVAKFDLERKENTLVYQNTSGSMTEWFTAMDISTSTNTILTGDNKGYASLYTLHGERVACEKLHSSKIHHCEFNAQQPSLIATSSLDTKGDHVKLWDLRNLKKEKPLMILKHSAPVNVAHFNHLDGSRLLTSDQKDEIRVYQGPLWDLKTTIIQGHRQFQHITPVKASWHPLSDVIVIGLYPKKDESQLARTIQFYDANNGKLIDELYPPENAIVSLNEFNSTGEILSSGIGCKLLMWKYSAPDPLRKQIYVPTVRGIVRPSFLSRVNTRVSSSDDDDDDDPKQKLKNKKSVANSKKRKREDEKKKNLTKGSKRGKK